MSGLGVAGVVDGWKTRRVVSGRPLCALAATTIVMSRPAIGRTKCGDASV
jgi:hypothetical protein